MYEVKRHSIERHPLFYFTSFKNPYSPPTDVVIVQIVYINENIPPPFMIATPKAAHKFTRGERSDHQPEVGNIYRFSFLPPYAKRTNHPSQSL
jgi:hypothetical protein